MAGAQNQHILAINESQDVLELFRELLEDEGYRVNTQAYVDKSIDGVIDLKPDLIILDYMWSTDDLGWSYLQMLKMSPKTSGIPIIVCTGAINRVEELRAHLNQLDIVVVFKPFELDTLLNAITEALDRTCSASTV